MSYGSNGGGVVQEFQRHCIPVEDEVEAEESAVETLNLLSSGRRHKVCLTVTYNDNDWFFAVKPGGERTTPLTFFLFSKG